jgi:Uma2 family endonuclease
MSLHDLLSSSSQRTAQRVSEAAYLAEYAEQGYEWVEGELVQMSPVTLTHYFSAAHLWAYLTAYFNLRPIGLVLTQPFLLRMAALGRNREPDLMVVLNANEQRLKDTYVDGAADICIEVVSVESAERDYRLKFLEYEAAGVTEYWLFNPDGKISSFYRRGEQGKYVQQHPDADGVYMTPLLPGFALPVEQIWAQNAPDLAAITAFMRALLADQA